MARGAFAFFGKGKIKRRVRTAYVYILGCPDTKRVRYIGITRDWRVRRCCHSTAYSNPKTPVEKWVTSLAIAGKKPIFRVIVKLQSPRLNFPSADGGGVFMDRDSTARAIEQNAIARALLMGVDLLNVEMTERCKTRKPRKKQSA